MFIFFGGFFGVAVTITVAVAITVTIAVTISVTSAFGFDAIHEDAEVGDAGFFDEAYVVSKELLDCEFVTNYIEHGVAIGAEEEGIGYETYRAGVDDDVVVGSFQATE
jgi:hypothetical protein